MIKEEGDLRRAAYHEAAHAVIAVLVHGKLEDVSIRWDDEVRPHCNVTHLCNASMSRPSNAIRQTRLVLAGPIAEGIAGGLSEPPWTIGTVNDDMVQAFKYGAHICGNNELGNAYAYAQIQPTTELVEKNWPAIEAVAEELLRVTRLTAYQVRAIAMRYV